MGASSRFHATAFSSRLTTAGRAGREPRGRGQPSVQDPLPILRRPTPAPPRRRPGRGARPPAPRAALPSRASSTRSLTRAESYLSWATTSASIRRRSTVGIRPPRARSFEFVRMLVRGVRARATRRRRDSLRRERRARATRASLDARRRAGSARLAGARHTTLQVGRQGVVLAAAVSRRTGRSAGQATTSPSSALPDADEATSASSIVAALERVDSTSSTDATRARQAGRDLPYERADVDPVDREVAKPRRPVTGRDPTVARRRSARPRPGASGLGSAETICARIGRRAEGATR